MKKFGFGAMRLPVTEADNPRSIDQEQLNLMVDRFMENGFTYFDTAYPYHEQMSEIAIRKALVERYDRDSFVLADKMPTVLVKSADEYPQYFEEQLEKCGVEYFDYYLLHNMGKDRYKKTQDFGGFEFCERMKAEGKIKKLGFSFHDSADVLERILNDHPDVDFVQLQINYLDWENEVIQSKLCWETAVKHGKQIVVMEPVKGGTLARLPKEAEDILKAYNPDASMASYALRFVASLDNVFMVLSGMNNIEQVIENTAIMSDLKPLNEEELKLLEKVVEIIRRSVEIPCTSCGYCMEVCPKNIAIPALFGLYNNYKINNNFSNMYHERIIYNRGKSSDCLGCGRCVSNCPQHIDIPHNLKKIAAFEKK